MRTNILIIGGGASGLMLASLLPKGSATIVESNHKLGAKMLVSGGGKCNITNREMGTEYFMGEGHFVKPALDIFSQKKLLHWLEEKKLFPQLRKTNQYFCKNSAQELLDIFLKEVKKQKILLDEKVLHVTKRDKYFSVVTNKRTLSAEHVVVASGGLSFPRLGASPIGYDIAKSFGHTVIKTAPALVGFTVQKEQFFFKELSGTSTDVEITINETKCKGSLLFTHKGVSGPAVLDASLYWEKGKIEIDFLPCFSWDSIKGSNKKVSTLLPLPKRITKAFLVQLELEDKPFSKISPIELQKLNTLKHYIFAPAGTFGYTKAEVTKGGVCTHEVDANSMMSKKIEGLYFIGEVLDITGRLGGYNFQWAFSSAYICFNNLGRKNEH